MSTIGNLSRDEFDKLMDAIRKNTDDRLKQAFLNGNWGQSPVVSWQHGTSISPNISPTDKDASGKFPYQEPEQDEQGTYYGYKILKVCTCGCGLLISPSFPVSWNNGRLQSYPEPSEYSMFGIHFTKRMDNPCLKEYTRGFYSWVLVQCALSGTIVELEQGFRAQFAVITGVYDNGKWTSYKDYSERSATNSRRVTWEEEKYWKSDYDPTGAAYTYTISKKRKGGSNDLTFKF